MNYKKSIDTKELILQAAAKLFFEKGYSATTVRDIVAEANVSLSGLNYHFQSKADLAGIICQRFLKNFNSKIFAIIQTFTDDPALRDTIHIGYWAMIFITNNQCRDFYYELAKEDILRHNLIESDYQHFLDQANYLGLNISKSVLRSYAHIFVSAIIEIIIAKKENELDLTTAETVDLYNEFHLKLLDLDASRIRELIDSADRYMSLIHYDIHDLMNVTLRYED